MKNYTLLFFTLIALAQSCRHKVVSVPPSMQVQVLVDTTNVLKILPDADYTIQLYNLAKETDREASFRMTSVTDRLLNNTITLHVDNAIVSEENNVREDPLYRKRMLLKFSRDIKSVIKTYTNSITANTSVPQSECFHCFCNELTVLKESKAKKMVQLVYSDLQENSDILSVYSPATQTLLLQHPATIRNIFEDTHLLPDTLSACTVIFIFQPHDRTEDKLFNAMFSIYKQLLEKRGAVVLLKTNNSLCKIF